MSLSNVENCTVQGNNFSNNYLGLYLYDTSNSRMLNNTIKFNNDRIFIELGEYSIFANNTIKYSTDTGISINYSNYTVCEYNTIEDTDGGTYYDGEEVRKGRDPLDSESPPLTNDILNQIIGGSIFGVVFIGGLTIYILIKKRIIKIKR